LLADHGKSPRAVCSLEQVCSAGLQYHVQVKAHQHCIVLQGTCKACAELHAGI